MHWQLGRVAIEPRARWEQDVKALVYHGPHEMRWEDWPDPEPGPGEALVAVRAVGICGSDLHGYTGESGRRQPPMVMGHEATGEIVDLGPGLGKSKLGTQVVVQPILTCGSCDQCRTGYAHRCRNRRFTGGTVNGALAERLTAPVSNLLPLPEGVSLVHGTLVEPLSVGLHAARQAGDLTEHSVLIAGSGPIGLCTMIAAKRSGARAVAVTDIIPTRRDAAVALGADAALDPAQEDWRQELAQVVGAPDVDVAFDAVGISPTFEQAVNAVRLGGTVVAIGGWRTVPIDLSYIVTHEIHVTGSFNYTPEEFDEARLWLGDGHLDPRPFLINTHPLAEGVAVFAKMVGNGPEVTKVVLTSDV